VKTGSNVVPKKANKRTNKRTNKGTKRTKGIIKTTLRIDSLGLITDKDHNPTLVERIQIYDNSKKGGDCGCGKNKFTGGEHATGLAPVPFIVPQQNMIPFNKADNLANYSLSARNINGGKKTTCKEKGCKYSNKRYNNHKKGGSIMNMFNSASNVVTGASSNGVLSFGTIPGADTATKILYGVPLNNPSTWVQPVQQVYGQHNSPMV
jgi:hypothetical protein